MGINIIYVAPDESPPVMSDCVRSCQDVSLVTMGFSRE